VETYAGATVSLPWPGSNFVQINGAFNTVQAPAGRFMSRNSLYMPYMTNHDNFFALSSDFCMIKCCLTRNIFDIGVSTSFTKKADEWCPYVFIQLRTCCEHERRATFFIACVFASSLIVQHPCSI
jgi:hypothetical protein